MKSAADGSRSLGLRTNVLPQARASGNIQHGTMHGKLKGVMPATTPSGCRSVQLSIPLDTCSVKSPFSSCGIPQANSTTSMPRVTSPCASENTLPCSPVMSAASASRCSFSSARNRASTRARRTGGVSAHERHAACALATAARTSAALASATSRATAPVVGLNTGRRGPVPLTGCPPIQCGTVSRGSGRDAAAAVGEESVETVMKRTRR